MCNRLLYPIDAMPFDTTDARGMCDVTAVRARRGTSPSDWRTGLAVLFSSEFAIKSREVQKNNSTQTDFALIGGTTANR